MRDNRPFDVAIVGAGIVGICCALSLQRAGASVTVVDRAPPGEQASFGHAGVFGIPYCIPAASYAALKALPQMAADRDSPFIIRARALPVLLPWFRQFVRASGAEAVARNMAAAADLQKHNRADWDDLLELAQAADLVRWTGMLEVCETEASLNRARAGWQLMRSQGFQVEELSAGQVRDAEPAIAPTIFGGAVLPDAGHTINPLDLTLKLYRRFLDLGGQLVRDNVRSILRSGAECVIVGEQRKYPARQVVIAAGVQSPKLAAPFGNRVAVAAERGYHIMLADPAIELRRPVTSIDHKVVISSMSAGLRMTTMAEFTTPDAPADYPRAARVFRRAFPLLPHLHPEVTSRWVGSRPSTPDSLPVIARSPVHPSVFFAFGHGSRGLTVAATTGRLIAELVRAR